MNKLKLIPLLKQALIEDIGDRDLTSELLFDPTTQGNVQFIAKEEGIFCGETIIRSSYQLLEERIQVKLNVSDGQAIKNKQVIAIATGPIIALLKGERVVLNLIQRMSGIATKTNKAIQLLNNPNISITDTRKTTPGLNMLEKYAVRCGGGINHRYGLYDAVLIKDNHIAFAGSITNAVNTIREKIGHMIKIEVETESIEQVQEAVSMNVDAIMFDNQDPAHINKLAALVPASITTEVSGGIQLNDLPRYTNTNVNYISMGSLTHSVDALDMSVQVIT